MADSDDDGNLTQAEKDATSSCVVFIDHRTDACGGNLMGGTALFGATFRSAWEPTDFFLMELNTVPGIGLTVFYAGWDRSGYVPNYDTCIHHPEGSFMRYSRSVLSNGVRQHLFYNHYWQVNNWDIGIVAPGSSGCALFDQNHKVVGQLKGGTFSCNFADGMDRFGKFSDSWEGGGTSDTQLKVWLSPVQNFGSLGILNPATLVGSGPSPLCYGSNFNVTMPALQPGEIVNWSVSFELNIVTTMSNGIVVTPSSSTVRGRGTVTANVNGIVRTYLVSVGLPDEAYISIYNYNTGVIGSTSNPLRSCLDQNNTFEVSYKSAADGSNQFLDAEWSYSDNGIQTTSYGEYANFYISNFSGYTLSIKVRNECGWQSNFLTLGTNPQACSGYYACKVYPNPASNQITIEFEDTKENSKLPEQFDLFEESMYGSGKPVRSIDTRKQLVSMDRTLIMNVKDLNRGRYIFRVIKQNEKSKDKQSEAIRIILE